MVEVIRWFLTIHCFFFPVVAFSASILEESTMLKGYFGESLVDDIWEATGRKSISEKINPVLNGPDRIYLRPDGMIEIHEVKTYSSWAGKKAMKTTAGGKETFELSSEWMEHWIQKSLADTSLSPADRTTVTQVKKAMESGKCVYRFDEVNLQTQQVRFSEVFQRGSSQIELQELAGPTRLKNFQRIQKKKIQEFSDLRLGNVEKLLKSPRVHEWTSRHPLPQTEFERLHSLDRTVASGIITSEGRLLVAVRTGVGAGLTVFAFDAAEASYSYLKHDINQHDFEEKLWDAGIRGTAVGTCTAVTVLLGSNPAGWTVLAVGVGAYLITDTALTIWHEHERRKYVTIRDMEAWGIPVESILSIPVDSTLSIPVDSTLSVPVDSTLR